MSKAKETQGKFVMDLQLFSDSQPSPEQLQAQAMAILQGGGQEPQAAAPMEQPLQSGNNPQNSPQITENGGQVQEGQEPSQAPQGLEQPSQAPNNADQLILGKFRSPDELANGYVNVEKAFSQKAQEASALQQQNEQLQAALEQMKQQIGNVVNPQSQEPQMTPEQMNEQFMNQFYENPTQSIQQMVQSMIEKAVMPQIQPIKQQYEEQQAQQQWSNNLNQFAVKTPDFEQWKPHMQQIMESMPNLYDMPNGLEVAYNMAKGQNYQEPTQLLQNQDFVKQNILGNQDIKNQIIQEYLQSLKQGNQAPTVISGQANGSMPVMPENKPQNMDEADAIALKMMRG